MAATRDLMSERGRVTRRVAVALVVSLVLVACGDGGGAAEQQPTPTGAEAARFVSAHQALCKAVTQADEGDRAAARTTFYDHAHQALHELAAPTADHDRLTAAHLLEAKQQVEALLEDRGDVAEPLRALTTAVERAIDATGQHPPAPCNKGER